MNFTLNSNVSGLKVRRQKFGIGSLLFLLLFGSVFTGVGIFALNSSKIDKSWTRISGEVVDSSNSISDGSTIYTPIIAYKVNGQSYRVTSSTGSSFHPTIGDPKEVAYNPQQPDDAKVVTGASSISLLLLFPITGIIILILAPIMFIRSLRRNKDITQLVQSGQKVQGVVVDVQSTSSTDNDTSYKIVVSAPNNNGTVQNYVSDTLTGIGGLAMADFHNNPIPIDVYIDPSNPQNYYVDVSDVPNLTPERIGELIKSVVSKQQPQPPPPSQPPLT